MRDDDALRELFAPLREPESVDDRQVQDVLAAAAGPARPARRRSRRRQLLAGISATVAVTVSVIAITAVDQGHPGTFVGEAGARELLTAAADATRDDPAPKGWRWLKTVNVIRRVVEGKRCPDCAVERGVVEDETIYDDWSGPRGESYRLTTMRPPRAVENAELLEVAGVLDLPPGANDGVGLHSLPRNGKTSSIEVDAGFGLPGMILDPQGVPETPKALIRWVHGRLKARDRAWVEQEKKTNGRRSSSYTRASDVNSALIDLATSPQLSGRQQAAAFEALAETPGATVVALSPELAAPDRVGVQISRTVRSKEMKYPSDDRVIVFDRASHRVIAEQRRTRGDEAPFKLPFVNVEGLPFDWLVDGGNTVEVRFAPAVGVTAPGLDADGKRLLDISQTRVSPNDPNDLG